MFLWLLGLFDCMNDCMKVEELDGVNGNNGQPYGRELDVPMLVLDDTDAESEDGLYLLPGSHCGLSFRFSIQSRWPTGRSWTMEELIRRHGNQPVARILVTRCLRTA